MNKAPATTTGNNDLSRWAKGIGADSDYNQPNPNNDLLINKHPKGTSAKLKPKHKQQFDGLCVDENGPEYNASASVDLWALKVVKSGTPYLDFFGATVPADPGSYICIKPVPPQDTSYWSKVTLYDASSYQRTGSVIYYPQSSGNQYWFPLAAGTGIGTGGDVWL
jgi:hypothetical protein